MEFHSLPRRDLQALCKKNRIPANMTNVAMADSLQALQVVEGIGEIQELLQFQSPMKPEAKSPDLPRTGRRTSARRAPMREEPKEQQASPLPRARRVTVKASEIMAIVAEEEEDKSRTPATSMGPKTRALSTRRRASNKEEVGEEKRGEENQEGSMEIPDNFGRKTRDSETLNAKKRGTKKEGGEFEAPPGIPITPAARNGCRSSVRRMAQTTIVKAKEEKASEIVKTYCRTRQSSRKLAVETMIDASANAGRKSSEKAIKMGDLEQEGKDVTGPLFSRVVSGDKETRDHMEQNKESDELQMEVMKPLDLVGTTTSNLCARDSGAKIVEYGATVGATIDDEDCQQSPNSGMDGAKFSLPEGFKECNDISVSEDSPIRGLVCLGDRQVKDLTQDSALQNPCTEITKEEGSNGGSSSPLANLDIIAEVSVDDDLSGDVQATSDGSGNHIVKKEGKKSDLLLTGEVAVESGVDLLPNHAPESKEAGSSPSSDAVRSLTVEAGEVDLLITSEAREESGDGEGCHDLPCKIRAESEEFSGNDLINDLTQPESELILHSAPSPLLQVHSPDQSMLILEDGRSQAKSPAQVDDLIGESQSILKSTCSPLLQVQSADQSMLILDDGRSPVKSPAQVDDLTGESQSILKTTSSPLLQAHSPVQSSNPGQSPAKPPAELLESKIGAKDPSAPSWISGEGNEKRSAARGRVPVGIYREGNEDDDKENKSDLSLTRLTGGGEAKLEDKAEKQLQPLTDLKGLSLRKLKAIYREEVTKKSNNSNGNEKLEGKRTALTTLNENNL